VFLLVGIFVEGLAKPERQLMLMSDYRQLRVFFSQAV
jgi:hypothetical protein